MVLLVTFYSGDDFFAKVNNNEEFADRVFKEEVTSTSPQCYSEARI